MQTARAPIESLLADFFASRSATTRSCYRTDFAALAEYMRVRRVVTALRALLASGEARANAICNSFRAAQLAAGVSHATANRRMAAIRSFVRCARAANLVDWRITVQNITPPLRRSSPSDKWRPLQYRRTKAAIQTAERLLIQQLREERDQLQAQLAAWHSAFGTTQLTHALARFERAERAEAAHEPPESNRDDRL